MSEPETFGECHAHDIAKCGHPPDGAFGGFWIDAYKLKIKPGCEKVYRLLLFDENVSNEVVRGVMEPRPESEWPKLGRVHAKDESFYVSWIGDYTFMISSYPDE